MRVSLFPIVGALQRLPELGPRQEEAPIAALRNRSRGLYSGAKPTGRTSAGSPFQIPRHGQPCAYPLISPCAAEQFRYRRALPG